MGRHASGEKDKPIGNMNRRWEKIRTKEEPTKKKDAEVTKRNEDKGKKSNGKRIY